MATLEYDENSKRYRVRFRYGERPFKRSLKTTDCREAHDVLGRINDTVRMLEQGRIKMPPDADPGIFILSGGTHAAKTKLPEVRTVAQFFSTYQNTLPVGTKEESTLVAERRHMEHLERLLRPSTEMQSVTLRILQDYVNRRGKENWRGKLVQSATIKKELATFRFVWHWGVRQGLLHGSNPVKGILLPKQEHRMPFKTWEQIASLITRNKISEADQKPFWDCLFLRSAEIEELLDDVMETDKHRFVYPLFTFLAHTGCRRSELARSEVGDLNFQDRIILLREKKRSHQNSLTFRRVPMTHRCFDVLKGWLGDHPGGKATFPGRSENGLTSDQLSNYFYNSLSKNKWKHVRGFHVFRHSFASNCAAAGVDQRIIDDWLGHQTEEMRRRYRHLFPEQQRAAIESVFQRNG